MEGFEGAFRLRVDPNSSCVVVQVRAAELLVLPASADAAEKRSQKPAPIIDSRLVKQRCTGCSDILSGEKRRVSGART